MNKREIMLNLVNGEAPRGYTPAAFFLHFDPEFHQGQAAVEKHLEFFHFTGMDFVKIQYEQRQPPPASPLQKPEDWARAPLYPAEFFAPAARVVESLVKAAGSEALVVLTLYSPFMWAGQWGGEALLVQHLRQDPGAMRRGIEIMTENVANLVRACKRVGVDGFYASTQGGETERFGGTAVFEEIIKPSDLRVWAELEGLPFNILHVCDYVAPYDDLAPFLDYPGQVVNCSLKVGGREYTPKEAAALFGRPFMGGMERLGTLATGSQAEIRREARRVLAQAPERFILAADCTVPSGTPWDNLRAAIGEAHGQSGF